MSISRLQLLIIDPQNDFCDLPAAALPVPGADADLQRLSELIYRQGHVFNAIHVTLDTHQPLDIAHPHWWCDPHGAPPLPFTTITIADVENGRWRARHPQQQEHSLSYVRALAARQRYQLMIWPEHCLADHWGQQVHAALAHSLAHWEQTSGLRVNYVSKGHHPGTEHYSAIQAEVPDIADASSGVDHDWIKQLAAADTLVIAGQALSHCVASTVRDLAIQLGEPHIGKMLLLSDCSSPVVGFEAHARQFMHDMHVRGMRIQLSNTLDLTTLRTPPLETAHD